MLYGKQDDINQSNWWLVRVNLVATFDCLPQNFWEVAGTNEWYFVILLNVGSVLDIL